MCLSSTCSGSTWLVTVTVVTASLSELGRARWPSTMFVLENARYCKNTTYLSSSVVWLQQEGQARAADSCMFICLSPHSSFCLLYRFIHSFIPSIQPMVFPSLHPLLIFCNHPSIHPCFYVPIHPSTHHLRIINILHFHHLSIHPLTHPRYPSLQLSYSPPSGLHSCTLSLNSSTLFTNLSMRLYIFPSLL